VVRVVYVQTRATTNRSRLYREHGTISVIAPLHRWAEKKQVKKLSDPECGHGAIFLFLAFSLLYCTILAFNHGPKQC
jgi:hypothetical protein